MILRKPYAFLIKNFRLIHIILTVLMFLFYLKMRSIVNFFDEYISTGTYSQMLGVVKQNIGFFTYFLPLLIIAIVVVVLYLLKLKNKQIKFYIFTIITYFVEMGVIIVAHVVLNGIQLGTANATFIQIFRDLIDAMSYITVPFIIFALARGVGFNVKQFNFKKDLLDLDISEADSEEFEVDVEVDTEDLRAKINRKLRFIKYIYLENKIAFFGVIVVLVLAIVLSIVFYIGSKEKIYKENETFSSYSLNLKVNNSYKTRYGTDGLMIRSDKFYVIVELDATNNLNQDTSIPYDNIFLRVDNLTKYIPIDNYRDEFSDLGMRFVSTDVVKSSEHRQIVLVFEVDIQYENNALRLEYLSSISDNNYKYAKIDLTPKEFKESKNISEKSIGEKLTFDNSFVAGTDLQIDEVAFGDRYSYKYKQMIGTKEREFTKSIIPTDTSSYRKKIMRLKTSMTQNNELNPIIYTSFYEKFAQIEYEENGSIIKQKPKIIDLTPINSDYVYLEVIDKVATSKKVTLVFTIRDKEYRYNLIDKKE